ncbi:MAG: PASTA domain-containing protein [Acidimicrobiales bacterium]
MASTRIADHIGRVLGDRYRLVAAIGTGSSAHVFLADDVRLRRRVAVKILHPALASDESFLRRFRAEARAAAALNHPNIMAVYDWGEEADGPYLVCEYLGGGSLRTMLDRGSRLSPSQALMVGLEAAQGLDYAHRRGLVHRDIKPANLLFDDDGRLRIADFGLARALAEATWTEPAGAVLGTARYASPEQARGAPVDGKADVYALALVLVESVTGQVPFAADTTVATLMGRVDQSLPTPPELGPLGPVVARAGRVDAGERLDAAALASALRSCAVELPSPGRLPLAGTSTFDPLQRPVLVDPTDIGDATVASVADPRDLGDGAYMADLGEGDPTVAVPAPASLEDPTSAYSRAPGPTRAAPAAYDQGTPAGVAAGANPAGRRRRRWPVVVMLFLVLAGVGAGVATLVVKTRVPTHAVPRLTGLDQAQATASLKGLGFDVVFTPEFSETVPAGQVISQDPAAGVRLEEGKQVRLLVSDGPPPSPVPDLTGLTQAEAQAEIEKAGHEVGKVTTTNSETVRTGVVLDWSHRGESPPKGTEIDLNVSAGPEKRTVPEVIGDLFDDVVDRLRGLGLVGVRADAYSDDDDSKGKVVDVSPNPGERVDKGSKVTLTVSSGRPSVPSLIGLSFDAAKAKLADAGLKASGPFGPSITGRVFNTVPASGTKVKPGSTVVVYTL